MKKNKHKRNYLGLYVSIIALITTLTCIYFGSNTVHTKTNKPKTLKQLHKEFAIYDDSSSMYLDSIQTCDYKDEEKWERLQKKFHYYVNIQDTILALEDSAFKAEHPYSEEYYLQRQKSATDYLLPILILHSLN